MATKQQIKWAKRTLAGEDYLPWADVQTAKRILGLPIDGLTAAEKATYDEVIRKQKNESELQFQIFHYPKAKGKIMLKQTDTITLNIDGTEVSSWLPPYLWMYPNPTAKLAIDARLGENGKGGTARLTSDVLFVDATEDDVRDLLAKTKLATCPKCGKPAFDHTVMNTNREGMCEECFVGKLNAEWKKEAAKETKRRAAKDKRMLAKGYKFRIDAWIHPQAGGDDFQLEMYSMEKLTDAEIQKEIKKEGSRKLDDFTQTNLEG